MRGRRLQSAGVEKATISMAARARTSVSAEPLDGALVGRVPASKSLCLRWIWTAALSRGVTRLGPLNPGQDVRQALVSVATLGARVREEGARAWIEPACRGVHAARWEAGESGTLASFLLAAAGLGVFAGGAPRSVAIGARGSLRQRRRDALLLALVKGGATLGRPGWPIEIEAAPARAEWTLERPSSSQEVSALLFALAAQSPAGRLIVLGPIPSRPYVDMTIRVLRLAGLRVTEHRNAWHTRFALAGTLTAPAFPVRIEPDFSLAAFVLASGALRGVEARVGALTPRSPQGDRAIVPALNQLGCTAGFDASGVFVRGVPQRSADFDLCDCPDLAPVLVPLCARAVMNSGQPCTLRGLETLAGKESSRLDVLVEMLERTGFVARGGAGEIEIRSRRRAVERPLLDSHGDHRMAFAAGLFAHLCASVELERAEAVHKTWPRCWADLQLQARRA